MSSACWREPITTTAATYSAGCQKNEQTAIAAAIATHSSAVAPIAFAGSRTDNSLIVAGGRRSGMILLVLCGCFTTGFLAMSSVGVSARRKVTILVIRSASIVSFLSRPSESVGLLIPDSSLLETIRI